MQDAIHIAGPTASGKTGVALALAERLGGEIISVDSMQVYRDMDIGTAKPTEEERRRIAHHLIDVADVNAPFDAAQFLVLAKEAVESIRLRGKIPIFCGGTGLYFNALIDGLACENSDPALRAELESTPLARLLQELQSKDPATFDKIDRQNPRRVIRAVEKLRSGLPMLAWKRVQTGRWFGLERDRADLQRRIHERVETMFRDGLVNETRSLLERGLESNRTAMQAIGYRQVVEHLHGDRDLSATVDLIKIKTRQYAKRQVTWFRHQLNLEWIPIQQEQDPVETAEMVMRKLEARV